MGRFIHVTTTTGARPRQLYSRCVNFTEPKRVCGYGFASRRAVCGEGYRNLEPRTVIKERDSTEAQGVSHEDTTLPMASTEERTLGQVLRRRRRQLGLTQEEDRKSVV